jgi:hypothetical protein
LLLLEVSLKVSEPLPDFALLNFSRLISSMLLILESVLVPEVVSRRLDLLGTGMSSLRVGTTSARYTLRCVTTMLSAVYIDYLSLLDQLQVLISGIVTKSKRYRRLTDGTGSTRIS